jgi:hypothetical protein
LNRFPFMSEYGSLNFSLRPFAFSFGAFFAIDLDHLTSGAAPPERLGYLAYGQKAAPAVTRLPSRAIRSTPWGESLHPLASPGANRSRVWAIFPDSCANFPIGAFWSIGTGLASTSRQEPNREVGCHEPPGPRGRPFAGGYSVPVCAVFRLLSNSSSIPPKEILS